MSEISLMDLESSQIATLLMNTTCVDCLTSERSLCLQLNRHNMERGEMCTHKSQRRNYA